mmetsp:Transcript_27366/g.45637  ORF Transcript_27366/g.45637 Transcript_27366/m.45637 type:complete len:95 (+) Transcript_27366:710-994(+)
MPHLAAAVCTPLRTCDAAHLLQPPTLTPLPAHTHDEVHTLASRNSIGTAGEARPQNQCHPNLVRAAEDLLKLSEEWRAICVVCSHRKDAATQVL